MKLNRMFEIVYLLLERKKVTANELAEYFEVSKRTILRDIEALSIAGIPIYTTKGNGGGISLIDNFVLDKTVMTMKEQNQLLFALESLGATKYLDAQNILVKLQTLFGKTDTSWIEVDFSRWGNEEADNELFELLKEAIIQERAVSFVYSNASGEITTKQVYPLKLLFKSRAWYVQAYCLSNQECRTYKINRMNKIEILSEGFTRKNFLSLEIKKNERSIENIIYLKIQVSKELAFRIYDEFKASEIQRNLDGTLLVSTQLPEDYWLYSFLLSLGSAAQVIAPEHVKQNLLVQVNEIRKNYLDDEGDRQLSP